MAKKKKITMDENIVSNEEILETNTITSSNEEPYAEKVRTLRGKGFNSNQIAAMLMIHKHLVENVK